MAREDRPKWHPILSAREYEPGRWVMFDGMDKPYALVDFIRRGDELGYRATTWRQEQDDRRLIGYFKTLHGATERVHGLYIERGVPHGAPNGASLDGWPEHVDPWA